MISIIVCTNRPGSNPRKIAARFALLSITVCSIASIARLNAQTFQPYWDAAHPGSLAGRSMVARGGTLYSTAYGSLYQWTMNGGWHHLARFGGCENASLGCLALNGNFLYVGGAFTSISTNGSNIGQLPANNVAKLDLTSGVWSDLGKGQLTNPVIEGGIVADANNNVYAGFSLNGWSAGTTSAEAFRKFDGTNWAAVGHGLVRGFNMPYDTNGCGDCKDWKAKHFVLATDGTNIFVGGNFSDGVNANGTRVHSPSIIKWDGTNWQPMGKGIYNPCSSNMYFGVNSIAVSGTNVFVTGEFGYGTCNQGGGFPDGTALARFSTSGTYIPTARLLYENTNCDSEVPAGYEVNGRHCVLAARNGIVYVTGFFDTIENTTNYASHTPDPAHSLTVNGIAQWDGTNWSALGPGLQYHDGCPASGHVITADNNAVYVGGWTDGAGLNGNDDSEGDFYSAGGSVAINGPLVRWIISPQPPSAPSLTTNHAHDYAKAENNDPRTPDGYEWWKTPTGLNGPFSFDHESTGNYFWPLGNWDVKCRIRIGSQHSPFSNVIVNIGD
ncbi:MAG: hypothetical protein ABSH15_09680 [Verrucomicrobiota bacterium]|jgi:hypothetical protein